MHSLGGNLHTSCTTGADSQHQSTLLNRAPITPVIDSSPTWMISLQRKLPWHSRWALSSTDDVVCANTRVCVWGGLWGGLSQLVPYFASGGELLCGYVEVGG